MKMNAMAFDVPLVESFIKSPLDKLVTIAANNCAYSGSTKDLIITWIHPLFLKANAAASKEDNQSGGKLCVTPLQTNTGK